MAASVRIEDEAFSDARVELLGSLAGYNRYEALGRLAHLWRLCTQRQLYVVSESMIAAILGLQGVAAILEAELGERVDGGIRVAGTDGRIEWLGELSEKRVRAGQARAATAIRDARGRLVSSKTPAQPPAHAGGAGPAQRRDRSSITSTPADLPRENLPDREVDREKDQHTSKSPACAGDAGPAPSSGPPAQSSAPSPSPSPIQNQRSQNSETRRDGLRLAAGSQPGQSPQLALHGAEADPGANGPPEPKTRGTGRKTATGAHPEVITAYLAAYEIAHGHKPTIGPKQAAQVATLLRSHGSAEIQRRLGILADRRGPAWLYRDGGAWDLNTLVANFDKLAVPAVAERREAATGGVSFFLDQAKQETERDDR